MALLKIARMGHPVLRRVAEPVADPRAPVIHRLIADMIDTMRDAPGVGLAAPQVHVPLRVVVLTVPPGRSATDDSGASDAATDGAVPLTVLINPEIEPLGDDMSQGWEACLSVPGLSGLVPRFRHIRYRWLSPEGTPMARQASGFHARVVQHECDHLDGILYPQRMTDLRTLGFVEEQQRARQRDDTNNAEDSTDG